MQEAKPKKRRLGVWIGVAVAIVVVIVVVAAVALPPQSNTKQIDITAVDLQINYAGSTTGYLGPTSQVLNGSVIANAGQKLTDTFSLVSSALLLDHTIESITITTPGFALVSMSPQLPYSLSPGSSVALTLVIQTPNTQYTGPLGLQLTTD